MLGNKRDEVTAVRTEVQHLNMYFRRAAEGAALRAERNLFTATHPVIAKTLAGDEYVLPGTAWCADDLHTAFVSAHGGRLGNAAGFELRASDGELVGAGGRHDPTLAAIFRGQLEPVLNVVFLL
jgi:hypothetical protein